MCVYPMLLERYENQKKRLLADETINQSNRNLFKKFFKIKEYTLTRRNQLRSLDDGCCKTLMTYISRFRALNNWLKNKEWKKLTEHDIKNFYDRMEDGKIVNKYGEPMKDRASFYNKIMKSVPFEIAKKKELAKKVLQYYSDVQAGEVRFFEESTFKKMILVAIKPEHKLLMYLCYDIGENIGAILQLKKSDCTRRVNENKEIEYVINLRKETLKRSRTPRSEINNFKETAEYLDIILQGKKDEDFLFNFGMRQADKILLRAALLTDAKVLPKGLRVTWKDFRSSMACYLLKEGWTTDEINARLGHKASSREIDKYVNFLAINKERPKNKLRENELIELRKEVSEFAAKEKLYQNRINRIEQEFQEEKDRADKEKLEAMNLTGYLIDSINDISYKMGIKPLKKIKSIAMENNRPVGYFTEIVKPRKKRAT